MKIIAATDSKCVGALIDFGNFADEARYQGAFWIEYEGKGGRLEGVRKTKALLLKYW